MAGRTIYGAATVHAVHTSEANRCILYVCMRKRRRYTVRNNTCTRAVDRALCSAHTHGRVYTTKRTEARCFEHQMEFFGKSHEGGCNHLHENFRRNVPEYQKLFGRQALSEKDHFARSIPSMYFNTSLSVSTRQPVHRFFFACLLSFGSR